MKHKKIIVIVLSIITIIAITLGILFAKQNKKLENNKIQIIDATYTCAESLEQFYEDDTYIYYFPCIKSSSVFVKFPDGSKMLVVKALEEKKVTINELLKAGLEVHKSQK